MFHETLGLLKKSRDAQLAWSSCLRSSSSEGAKCKLSFLLTLKVWSKFNKVLIINKANLNLVWTTSQCSKSQKKSHSTLRAKRAAFTFWLVKIGGKCQNWKIEMRLFRSFSNTVRNRQQMNLTGDQIKLSSASNVVFSISYQQNTTRNLRAR